MQYKKPFNLISPPKIVNNIVRHLINRVKFNKYVFIDQKFSNNAAKQQRSDR